jgi:hypothetical protein
MVNFGLGRERSIVSQLVPKDLPLDWISSSGQLNGLHGASPGNYGKRRSDAMRNAKPGVARYAITMNQERRGLRFPFSARAEVILGSSRERIPARVMELSLQGCFIEISFLLKERQRVQVEILYLDKNFEALAEVIYVRPTGVGLVFRDMKPHFRSVLQAWILTALDNQAKSDLGEKI